MRQLQVTQPSRFLKLLLILSLTMLPGPAGASQIRPLNLDEMARRADRIFAGRCVDVRVEEEPQLGQPVTWVTLAVTRSVKGAVHGHVTIRLLGRQDARDLDAGEIDGLPRFAPGEEVVLFLYGDSSKGLTSPVGFGQGKFEIHKDKLGRRLAINSLANHRLLEGLAPAAERRLGAAGARMRGRVDIPADDLLDMARSLLQEEGP